MKKTEKKIKKIKLPLNKMTGNEKNYAAAILEDVNSNMKAFWEVIQADREDIAGLKNDVAAIKEDVTELKSDVNELKRITNMTFEEVGKVNEQMAIMNIKIEDIEKELLAIKNEIRDMKVVLSKKDDIEKLEFLEIRVRKIEQHLNFKIT